MLRTGNNMVHNTGLLKGYYVAVAVAVAVAVDAAAVPSTCAEKSPVTSSSGASQECPWPRQHK